MLFCEDFDLAWPSVTLGWSGAFWSF